MTHLPDEIVIKEEPVESSELIVAEYHSLETPGGKLTMKYLVYKIAVGLHQTNGLESINIVMDCTEFGL